MFIGVVEALIILAAAAGGVLGLPLSIPPLPPDPVIERAAPDECLLHLSLAGLAAPDSTAANLTERMLADDEVRAFLAAIGREAITASQKLSPLPPAVKEASSTLATAMLSRPVAITLERFSPPGPGGPTEVVASVVLRTDGDADRLEHALDTLMAMLPQGPGGPPVRTIPIGSMTVTQLATPLGPLSWGVGDGSLVVTVGPGAIESLLERLGDTDRAAPVWKTAAIRRLEAARPATTTFVNAAAIVQILKARAASGDDRLEALLDASGLEDLESLVAATGMDDQGMVADFRLAFTRQPTGIFAPAAEGIGAAELSRVPADAVLVQSWSLDLSRMLATSLDLIDAGDPAAAAEVRTGLERFRAIAGFDLDEHLLRPLGPDWTVMALPSPGVLVPNLAVMAGLRDRDTFAKTHKALLGLLRNATASGPTQATVSELPYRGQTIYTLAVESPDMPLPIAPAWCLTDDRLIITLSPQLLKTLLARTDGDPSLLAVPEVQRAIAATAEADLVSVLDPQPLLASLCSLYELATPYVRQTASRAGMDVMLPTLPRMTALMPSARPSVTIIHHESEAIAVRTTSTLPLGPLGGGGGIMAVSPVATPVMIGLLVPAVQSAREAARRAQSMNHFKQVLLAMHNYHDAYGRFPAQAICDAEGRPLLSWRVALLPFLEEQALYDEFHLDEPWDSDHNRPLLARMPAWLADPNADPETIRAGLTTTQVFTGPGTAYADPAVGPRIRDITDGLSNTIALIEVNPDQAVPWTKPEDHVFDPEDPLAGIGQPRRTSGVYLGGFFDGSVRPFAPDIAAEVFRDLVTPTGGEAIDVP